MALWKSYAANLSLPFVPPDGFCLCVRELIFYSSWCSPWDLLGIAVFS